MFCRCITSHTSLVSFTLFYSRSRLQAFDLCPVQLKATLVCSMQIIYSLLFCRSKFQSPESITDHVNVYSFLNGRFSNLPIQLLLSFGLLNSLHSSDPIKMVRGFILGSVFETWDQGLFVLFPPINTSDC